MSSRCRDRLDLIYSISACDESAHRYTSVIILTVLTVRFMSRPYQPQLSMQNSQTTIARKLGRFRSVEYNAQGNRHEAVEQRSESKSHQCLRGQVKVPLS